MARIGLVAGKGKLPIIFSEKAKTKGDTVIVFALKGITDEGIGQYADKVHWFNWGDLKKAALLLATERIKKVIMLGKIEKELFFKKEHVLDQASKAAITGGKDKRDYSILSNIAKFLGTFGVEVISATTYMDDFVPQKGTLTNIEPSASQWEDINYGNSIAKEFAHLDIGQTVIVKDKTVIAVEAMEGTDNTIERAGNFTHGGFVVVKAARPNQDMRFDVPLIGLDTLKTLVKAKGSVLALEAGKMLLMDKEELIKLAEENHISIVVI